jgi:hypothetical protein
MKASGEIRLVKAGCHISPKRTLTRILMKSIHPVKWEQRDRQRHPADYSTGGQQKMKIKTFTPWNSNRLGAEKKRAFIPLGNNRYLESRNNFSFLLSRFLHSALAFAFCFLISQFLLLPSFAQTNVTPAQYLASQPKPNFALNYSLPHLTRFGFQPASNAMVALAKDWGYVLMLGNGGVYTTSNLVRSALTPGTTANGFLLLASNQPSVYKLGILIDRTFPYPTPSGFWCTNSSGQFVDANTNTWATLVYTNINGNWVYVCSTNANIRPVVSPEGPDDYWQTATAYWMTNLMIIESNSPISVILNGGEYGLNVLGFGGDAWKQDPRVQSQAVMTNAWATTNLTGTSWPSYTSSRKAHQLGFLTSAIKQQLPNRGHYIFYDTGNEETRDYQPGYKDWKNIQNLWGWWSENMNTNTDLPSFQSYFYRWQGWTNPAGVNAFSPNIDLLTEQLNGVGYDISLGYPLNYSWLSGGWDNDGTGNTNQLSDIPRYTGFLNCLYTAGMVGGIAGFFSNGTDTNNVIFEGPSFSAAFPSNSPPHWLLQMMALSHVHALFSHLDNFLYDGDLLSGPQPHLMSADQPAYEFTNTAGYVNDRVLARRMHGTNLWLVTAWAADGITNNVTITIPTIGNLTVAAIPSASVYQVTMSGTNVQQTLLDEYVSFPERPPPPNNLKVLAN